jgi:hypothetical protein
MWPFPFLVTTVRDLWSCGADIPARLRAFVAPGTWRGDRRRRPLCAFPAFAGLTASLQEFVSLAACVIAMKGNSTPNGEKTLASLLCAYIALLLVLVRVCIIFVTMLGSSSSITARNDLELRVVFVAACLAAALRLLDGRVSFRD